MSRRLWSVAELDLLRSMYPECHTEDVAAWVGRTVGQCYQTAARHGLCKSAEYLASDAACRVQRGKQHPSMIATRFKKGQPSWTKGTKGVVGVQEACRATQFVKGQHPYNTAPIGSHRISKDGYLQRKVTDTGYPPKDWQSVHSLVWIEAHGPIPAGHVVVFKVGKKTTDVDAIRAADLECLSRADLMRRNSYHNYPPEVAHLVQLRGALNRQINKRSRSQETA